MSKKKTDEKKPVEKPAPSVASVEPVKKKEKMQTVGGNVLRCTCKHETQDSIYGFGMRVHTPVRKMASGSWRCTVCGATR